MSDLQIVEVEIRTPNWGASEIFVKYPDKDEWVKLMEYYSDEISFVAEELLGITAAEASKLHFEKDKAYLQS